MKPHDLSDAARYRIYQLMRGGIDETRPKELATLAGVEWFGLTRDFLAAVFIDAQRRWGGLCWDAPTANVRIDRDRRDDNPRYLSKGRNIDLVCNHCRRVTRRIPCLRCPGMFPSWSTKRIGRQSPFGYYNAHGWFPVTSVQAVHEIQFKGGNHAGRH